MRLSCNGCRVLRKGCSEGCSVRQCLQWIKSPEAQANATVFLAKFYGRAGLMNLINAGPHDLRPAIFRSLMYEACGRIVNPIYGSVGLLWSGNWQMCQAAVEAVLKGAPIVQISSEVAAANPTPALKAYGYDIRHVSKLDKDTPGAAATGSLHKVAKPGRTRFKRASSASPNHRPRPRAAAEEPDHEEVSAGHHDEDGAFQRALSHESSDSHDDHVGDGMAAELEPHCQDDQEASEAEAGSHVSQAEQSTAPAGPGAENVEEDEEQQLGLDLTLGFAPVAARVTRPAGCHLSGWSVDEPAFVGLRFL